VLPTPGNDFALVDTQGLLTPERNGVEDFIPAHNGHPAEGSRPRFLHPVDRQSPDRTWGTSAQAGLGGQAGYEIFAGCIDNP
jgi:hypothetical protein